MYSSEKSDRFTSALYPCRYLLSKIEDSAIESPKLPASLTMERVLIINQAIMELSLRCIDQIIRMLCKEIQVSREELKSTVAGNDSLKDQVFDLVVDAEKKSKRKILDAEGVEESHLIICGLLFKDNELYAKKMEEMANARMEKLAELGLNNQCHVCRKH